MEWLEFEPLKVNKTLKFGKYYLVCISEDLENHLPPIYSIALFVQKREMVFNQPNVKVGWFRVFGIDLTNRDVTHWSDCLPDDFCLPGQEEKEEFVNLSKPGEKLNIVKKSEVKIRDNTVHNDSGKGIGLK